MSVYRGGELYGKSETPALIAKMIFDREGEQVPTRIEAPTRVEAAGNKPKLIDEYVGRVNSATDAVSVAHMRSPGGWVEPGQSPEFDEFTIVLRGTLRVEYQGGLLDVHAGQ